MRMIDLTGRRFNMLEVLHRAETNRHGRVSWVCKCDCGNTCVHTTDHLIRPKHPVKSCGCALARQWGKNHPQWSGFGDISGAWWKNHVTRDRGRKTLIPVEIDIEYAWKLFLKQDRKCALTGVDLVIGMNRYNTASLDRIDSSIGYIPGNIQWVHKHINFMKRTYSQEYFIEMCKLVAERSTK